MWPLTDTALHLIDEANLISARCHGIELDLEGRWRAWSAVKREPEAVPRSTCLHERMRDLDKPLLDVLLHAWPLPKDPVVIALQHEAECMRNALHAEWHRIGKAESAAHGCKPGQDEFRGVEHSNGAAEITGCHHHEAVDQIGLALIQGEPEMMEQGAGKRKGEGAEN